MNKTGMTSLWENSFTKSILKQMPNCLLKDYDLRMEQSRCRFNIDRTVFFTYILLAAEFSNLLICLITNFKIRHVIYINCSTFLLILSILAILVFYFTRNLLTDIKKWSLIYRTFWCLYVIGAITFCFVEYRSQFTMTNYLLMMVAISIFPVFSVKELLVFGGIAFVTQGIFILTIEPFIPENIQLYLITSIVLFFTSRLLRKSYYAVLLTKIQLEEMADTDSMTGVLNRRGFERRLKYIWAGCVRHNSNVMVAMVDTDFFKKYNDKFGHYAGDKCLTTIAQNIAVDFKRITDLFARYGGEEFILFAAGLPDNKIEEFLNRIITRIESLQIEAGDKSVSDYVTVSIGCVSIQAVPGLTFEHLYQKADKELSNAKKNGRNAFSLNGKIYSGKCADAI
ncbi:MAG: GGDEF domain-containing protein [Clostridiales bacterium]|nr:GGDEF domain-containing protein [Clostridiales bacterium]